MARSSAAAFFSRSAFASATSWLSISKRTSPAATFWPARAGALSTTPDEGARDVDRARVADVHFAGEPDGLLERRGAGGDRGDQPRPAFLRHDVRVELHDAQLVAALVAGVVRDVVLALPGEQLVDGAVEVGDLGLPVPVAVALAVGIVPGVPALRSSPCASASRLVRRRARRAPSGAAGPGRCSARRYSPAAAAAARERANPSAVRIREFFTFVSYREAVTAGMSVAPSRRSASIRACASAASAAVYCRRASRRTCEASRTSR